MMAVGVVFISSCGTSTTQTTATSTKDPVKMVTVTIDSTKKVKADSMKKAVVDSAATKK